jgi:hypothetical protein
MTNVSKTLQKAQEKKNKVKFKESMENSQYKEFAYKFYKMIA